MVLHNYTYINAQHAHLQGEFINSVLNKKDRSLQVNFFFFLVLKQKIFLKAQIILSQLFLNPEIKRERKT